jgi:hypothetical protein
VNLAYRRHSARPVWLMPRASANYHGSEEKNVAENAHIIRDA